MKPLLLALLLGCAPALSAQDPFADPAQGSKMDIKPEDIDTTKTIRARVEFFEMSLETFSKTISDPGINGDAALHASVQKLVDNKEAKIFEIQTATSQSGQPVKAGSIHEFIYPTEYGSDGLELSDSRKKKDGSKSSTESTFGYFGTAFETRNLGSSLEMTAAITRADGKVIHLSLTPEIVWHTGDTTWSELKDSLGNVTRIQMPRIYQTRISTNVICADGRYLLLGAVSPYDAEGNADLSRKLMIFLKCEVVTP